MAYSIYQTDCMVLGIREIQEHDLMLRVFSPMFGYVRVIAKGTRKVTSKLRANIQEFSVLRIAVVKGKEFFILTDASCIFSFVQSKSVVNFIRQSEVLFFDDENDHGTQVNADIYAMFLHVCKLLIWSMKEKKGIEDIELIRDFFTVYVKGLQGFVGKVAGVSVNISFEERLGV
jgi:hypothetical protein